MPLDHYIPQVHLRNFYSPKLGKQMYAVRKSDLTQFTPNSRSICAINDGSTNAYLQEDRAVEEFLKSIEPNYNASLEKLRNGKIDRDCIYTISGYIAYVISCSPGGMRIQTGPLKGVVESTAMLLDRKGEIPPPPPALGGSNLTELLHSGKVKIDIDTKYPQAIGIDGILQTTTRFGNFKWEVLRNHFEENPFFTSDFPVAIEETDDPRVLNRIVPLAPDLAIRIRPNLAIDREQIDLSFTHFGSRSCDISRAELVALNRLIVQCAEELVLYRDDTPWVMPFIKKYHHYRVESLTQKVPTSEGHLLISKQRIVSGRSSP